MTALNPQTSSSSLPGRNRRRLERLTLVLAAGWLLAVSACQSDATPTENQGERDASNPSPPTNPSNHAPTSEVTASVSQITSSGGSGDASIPAQPVASTEPENDAGLGSGDPVGPTAAGDAAAQSEPSEQTTSPAVSSEGALGAYPYAPSAVTRGGTMTFLNVGASGWWPRRLEREPGDAQCSYKDGEDTWGGHCCMEEHHTASENLAPFDEELTLILKSVHVKQLAVYQPLSSAAGVDWQRVTAWDDRTQSAQNLWFTQQGAGNQNFPGDLTANDCVGYLSQEQLLGCDDLGGYFCPDDPGVMHRGFAGSKLFVLLASMTFSDTMVQACDGDGAGHPGPWIALVASELVRDGARKWNGDCNCYSKTGTVGDGCGEMNVFEVVMDGNDFSNREFMSTGVRSYQAGHVGGAVCGADCDRATFGDDVEVVDACGQAAYTQGPTLTAGGETTGCPVWRRPVGDRYFLLLLDETERQIQVAIIHPDNIHPAVQALLPAVPATVGRPAIDSLLQLRLPQ